MTTTPGALTGTPTALKLFSTPAPSKDTMTITTSSRAAHAVLPVAPVATLLSPLSIDEARLESAGFWGTRVAINASATIDHCAFWQEKAGWLANFDAAATGDLPQTRTGREFSDSEAYKLIEAMAWEHGVHGDPALDASIRALTSRIGAAQEPDGYLNTNFGRPGQEPRYSDLEWGHELYNYGHLLQAAVARVRTAGRDELFEIALRAADHVCEAFGADGIQSVCGHPEIELGLMEFARLTGEPRYREQARLFIERRGTGTLDDIVFGRSYFQDDIPVREATVLRGHSVRALYLAAAAVDLAVDTDDAELLAAIELQWRNTVASRTYITGGMGSHHQDEAYGEDFVLPSDRAYCETCAGIAAVMLSWRLLLATGRPEYGDLIERCLFNIVATSPSDDGRSFFYANTLHQRTPGAVTDANAQSKRASSSMRAPWFDVSCCPNNVARTFASLGAYIATVDSAGLQLHQYANATIATELGDGRAVSVRVETSYPRSGEIRVTIANAPADPSAPWSLSLRVPGWAEGATVTLFSGATGVEVTRPATPGTVTLSERFAAGDLVTLNLPMVPRFSTPDPRIDAVRGSVAVELGPRVFCLESQDLPARAHVDQFIVDTETEPARTPDDAVTVRGAVTDPARQAWPYGADAGRSTPATESVRLVPYHSWANRGPGTMRVWLRTS
ncbi:beta-L-arabinofuranosidase domain-containing protein [Leifsonia sp. Root4]|uniref:glycoside hydrolase family 127 protein n=1 Tax=Leifsonia sp. Root4 TaxID=1736525 RepID=UPI000A58730B